jgi:hypothetical protein
MIMVTIKLYINMGHFSYLTKYNNIKNKLDVCCFTILICTQKYKKMNFVIFVFICVELIASSHLISFNKISKYNKIHYNNGFLIFFYTEIVDLIVSTKK